MTTPLGNGKLLSLKLAYYKQRTCAECSQIREKFKKLILAKLDNEKLFIIYENKEFNFNIMNYECFK